MALGPPTPSARDGREGRISEPAGLPEGEIGFSPEIYYPKRQSDGAEAIPVKDRIRQPITKYHEMHRSSRSFAQDLRVAEVAFTE
jgi:hypothetical protein